MSRDATKDKIINAARELFSQNGYDRTSTASIAKHAGVNSALIFYYFGNKENLFKSIFREIFHSYRDERNKRLNKFESIFSGKKVSDEILQDKLKDGMKFLESNEDLLRILLTETLKKSSSAVGLFEVNNSIYGDFLLKADNDSKVSLLLKELFFFALPNMMYTILKPNISDYYSIPADALDSAFTKVIAKVFSCIFKNQLNNQSEVGRKADLVEGDNG